MIEFVQQALESRWWTKELGDSLHGITRLVTEMVEKMSNKRQTKEASSL